MAESKRLMCADRQLRISQGNISFRPVRKEIFDVMVDGCAGINNRRSRNNSSCSAVGHLLKGIALQHRGLE